MDDFQWNLKIMRHRLKIFIIIRCWFSGYFSRAKSCARGLSEVGVWLQAWNYLYCCTKTAPHEVILCQERRPGGLRWDPLPLLHVLELENNNMNTKHLVTGTTEYFYKIQKNSKARLFLFIGLRIADRKFSESEK